MGNVRSARRELRRSGLIVGGCLLVAVLCLLQMLHEATILNVVGVILTTAAFAATAVAWWVQWQHRPYAGPPSEESIVAPVETATEHGDRQ